MVEVIVGREIKIKLNLSNAELKTTMTHSAGMIIYLSTKQIVQLQGAASIGIVVNNRQLDEKTMPEDDQDPD